MIVGHGDMVRVKGRTLWSAVITNIEGKCKLRAICQEYVPKSYSTKVKEAPIMRVKLNEMNCGERCVQRSRFIVICVANAVTTLGSKTDSVGKPTAAGASYIV
jgi:hypothetical protein